MTELRWRLVSDSGDGLFEQARRVVGRGQYRGLEFYEVEARSIINEVPVASHMPFRWTINAYRGCSHGCVYCMAGETPILTADGRTKPLANIRVGDEVYGTVRLGRYRRYTPTKVLAHWSTVKAAYRIVLEDGTELIASGDHRFLSSRGWKYVFDHGRTPRPHITIGTRLMGSNVTRSIDRTAVKSDAPLHVVSVEPMGVELPMFDITTGTGDFIANGVISHNCFARPTHDYLGFGIGEDFDRRIVVKVNAVDRVEAETHPGRWGGQYIAMGTNTDPYQPAEGRYKLTRGIIEVLTRRHNPFSILTKSTLVLRDLDLLVEAASACDIHVDFSIGTLDEEAWKQTEPGTPHPIRRVEAVARLNESGVPSGVLMAPILPGISDRPEQLRRVVKACKEAGATFIYPILLHLRPGVREHYLGWLKEAYPDLVATYEDLYQGRSYLLPQTATRLRRIAGLGSPERDRLPPKSRRPTQLRLRIDS